MAVQSESLEQLLQWRQTSEATINGMQQRLEERDKIVSQSKRDSEVKVKPILVILQRWLSSALISGQRYPGSSTAHNCNC